MTRLIRWTAAASTVLILLTLARPGSPHARRSPGQAAVADKTAPLAPVVEGFVRNALAARPRADWPSWATPQLAAALRLIRARRTPEPTLHIVELHILDGDEHTARVAVEATFTLRGRTVPVALVLTLVATPAGWRIDGIAP